VIYCYHYTCFRLSLFSDINVSQGSVATLMRCGGIFNANFIANLLTSQPVKELWKSANIWQSYRKNKKVCIFWDTVYIQYKAFGSGCFCALTQMLSQRWWGRDHRNGDCKQSLMGGGRSWCNTCWGLYRIDVITDSPLESSKSSREKKRKLIGR